MATDTPNRGPHDRTRIVSTTDEDELRYWTEELGVSADRLRELVAQHGNSAEKVRQAQMMESKDEDRTVESSNPETPILQKMPEGLQRERKGPLSPTKGRRGRVDD